MSRDENGKVILPTPVVLALIALIGGAAGFGSSMIPTGSASGDDTRLTQIERKAEEAKQIAATNASRVEDMRQDMAQVKADVKDVKELLIKLIALQNRNGR